MPAEPDSVNRGGAAAGGIARFRCRAGAATRYDGVSARAISRAMSSGDRNERRATKKGTEQVAGAIR